MVPPPAHKRVLGSLLAGLFLLASVHPGRAEPPELVPCLERVSRKLPKDRRLWLILRSGERVEGSFAGVGEESLRIRVYLAPVSRFETREVPGNTIDSIHYREKWMDWAPPALLALALGGVGLITGAAIHSDPDMGTPESRRDALILLPALGVIAGFAIGMVISATAAPSREIVIPCGSAAP